MAAMSPLKIYVTLPLILIYCIECMYDDRPFKIEENKGTIYV